MPAPSRQVHKLLLSRVECPFLPGDFSSKAAFLSGGRGGCLFFGTLFMQMKEEGLSVPCRPWGQGPAESRAPTSSHRMNSQAGRLLSVLWAKSCDKGAVIVLCYFMRGTFTHTQTHSHKLEKHLYITLLIAKVIILNVFKNSMFYLKNHCEILH